MVYIRTRMWKQMFTNGYRVHTENVYIPNAEQLKEWGYVDLKSVKFFEIQKLDYTLTSNIVTCFGDNFPCKIHVG